MNKIVKIVISTLIGAGCFSAGLYYATLEFDETLDNIMGEYEVISEQVDAFVDISNPETIRFYTTELRKLLDDISFLSKLIQTGQLADEAITDMMNSQDDVGSKLDSLYSELSLTINSIKDYNIAQDVVDERNLNSVKSLVSESADIQKKYIEDLNNQITQLKIKFNEVNEVIDKIKNSKLAKHLK